MNVLLIYYKSTTLLSAPKQLVGVVEATDEAPRDEILRRWCASQGLTSTANLSMDFSPVKPWSELAAYQEQKS